MPESRVNRVRRQVDKLLAEGVTLRDACTRIAQEEEIPDRPRVSGAAWVERQWAADSGPPSPSRVRAGRRQKKFL